MADLSPQDREAMLAAYAPTAHTTPVNEVIEHVWMTALTYAREEAQRIHEFDQEVNRELTEELRLARESSTVTDEQVERAIGKAQENGLIYSPPGWVKIDANPCRKAMREVLEDAGVRESSTAVESAYAERALRDALSRLVRLKSKGQAREETAWTRAKAVLAAIESGIISLRPIPPEDLKRASEYIREQGWVAGSPTAVEEEMR